jgi:hypothetical protein
MTDEPNAPDTPFDEDYTVSLEASLRGLSVTRSESIVITDRKALEDAGYVKKSLDLWRIRQRLNDGAEVRGAHFGPVEYTLRKKEKN